MAVHHRAWEQLQEWKPLGTYGILGAIGGVFILQLITLGINPAMHDFIFVISTDWIFRPWTLITSTFSHGGTGHILANGLMLYFMGPSVERILGLRRYLILFFSAGALSGVFQVHLQSAYVLWQNGVDPMLGLIPGKTALSGALGASGALLAIIGMMVIMMPHARVMLLFPPIPLKMWVIGVGYAVLDIIGAFNANDGIGNFAHLSGMALGIGYGLWFKKDLARRGLHLQYQ